MVKNRLARFQQRGRARPLVQKHISLGNWYANHRIVEVDKNAPIAVHRRENLPFQQQIYGVAGLVETLQCNVSTFLLGYGRLPHYLFDDVRPTLHQLKAYQLELGILSNHSTSVRQTIAQLLGDIIPQERLTISEEVGVHKPSQTIFRRAAARLRQNPANCLYVGDNLEVDALAAVAKGAFAGGIWIDRADVGGALKLPDKVLRITSLTQLSLFF